MLLETWNCSPCCHIDTHSWHSRCGANGQHSFTAKEESLCRHATRIVGEEGRDEEGIGRAAPEADSNQAPAHPAHRHAVQRGKAVAVGAVRRRNRGAPAVAAPAPRRRRRARGGAPAARLADRVTRVGAPEPRARAGALVEMRRAQQARGLPAVRAARTRRTVDRPRREAARVRPAGSVGPVLRRRARAVRAWAAQQPSASRPGSPPAISSRVASPRRTARQRRTRRGRPT
jgi:hypothetical protein